MTTTLQHTDVNMNEASTVSGPLPSSPTGLGSQSQSGAKNFDLGLAEWGRLDGGSAYPPLQAHTHAHPVRTRPNTGYPGLHFTSTEAARHATTFREPLNLPDDDYGVVFTDRIQRIMLMKHAMHCDDVPTAPIHTRVKKPKVITEEERLEFTRASKKYAFLSSHPLDFPEVQRRLE